MRMVLSVTMVWMAAAASAATFAGVTCSDGGASAQIPADATVDEGGALVLGEGALSLTGFAAGHSEMTVTVDATLPAEIEGTLVGWEVLRTAGENPGTYTARAEARASGDPIRYDGTKEHDGTATHGVPAARRHLWTLTYSVSAGATLWEDGRLLAEAPGIKWSDAPISAVTLGGGLAGLRIHAARVDFAATDAPENPMEALYDVPEALRGLGLGPLLHLLRTQGGLAAPAVSLNGEALGARDATLALWAFGLEAEGEVGLAVGRLEIGAGGAVSLTLSEGTPPLRNGALSLIGARRLEGPWERLVSISAPLAAGTTLKAEAPGMMFFKIRAEETVGKPGPLTTLRAETAERPVQAGAGAATLLTFTFVGNPEELGGAGGETLALTLTGAGAVPGGTYTLTVDGVAHQAVLGADGRLTFTGLAVREGSAVTLAGPASVNGEVTVAESSWGGAGMRAHVVAVVADDLVKDGFVPADCPLATEIIPGGYDATIYRIPALATDGEGGVVALYDVRYGSKDLGADNPPSGIDLGETYSDDFGVSWGRPRLAVDVPNFRANDGSYPLGDDQSKITKEMDIGDAALLFDPERRRYWLMAMTGGGLSSAGANASKNDCVLYTRGVGAEAKWEGRRSVKDVILAGIGKTSHPGRGVLAGPGHGMVTQIGREGVMPKGTLVFPVQAFVNNGTEDAQCCAAYSTDGGETWQTTGLTPKTLAQAPHNAQENCVMELDDGSWLMMSKGGNWSAGRRLFFRTTDFKTWRQLASVPNVIHVQGSCLRIGVGADGVGRYVFAHQTDPGTRAGLALIFGRDITAANPEAGQEGVDWDLDNPLMLHAGETGGQGYVSLCLLDSETLGVLYESNNQIFFERIDLAPYLR